MQPELILPGGDLERVKIAFLYGADAVYVGLNKYSLRKAEVRFDLKEIKEPIDYAHSIKRRLFVTFNVIAHTKDLASLTSDLKKISAFKPDAYIIADPGVVSIARRIASEIPIHLSTQANTINIESVRFWQKQGVKRIVLARELSLSEILEIHQAVPEIELEIFVHGAMCISYSGRCLLSSYMTGREANLGDCAQPCRWNYKMYLEEKMRPGEYYSIEESDNGTSVMSSKDLRLIRYLPEILDAGVTGLKIEGRNKSEYYLATTASAYKKALDLIGKNTYNDKSKHDLEKELEKLNFRGYTTGFLFGDAKHGEISDSRAHKKSWEYLGIFEKNNKLLVKNKIQLHDKVEVLTPTGVYQDMVGKLYNKEGEEYPEINPGKAEQKILIELSRRYPPHSLLRKKL